MVNERAIQTIALRDVVFGTDPDYILRRIFRWYSREFATPLHEVEQLPLHDILQHYWEDKFEEMARLDAPEHVKQNFQMMRRILSQTEEEARAARMEEDRDDAQTMRDLLVIRQTEEEAKKLAAAVQAVVPQLPPDVVIDFPDADSLAGSNLLDD